MKPETHLWCDPSKLRVSRAICDSYDVWKRKSDRHLSRSWKAVRALYARKWINLTSKDRPTGNDLELWGTRPWKYDAAKCNSSHCMSAVPRDCPRGGAGGSDWRAMCRRRPNICMACRWRAATRGQMAIPAPTAWKSDGFRCPPCCQRWLSA